MFRGETQHNLDSKGRIILPARFREILGDGFIVTRGLDKCLFVFSREEWEKIEAKVAALPLADPDARQFSRFFVGGSADSEIDGQGRAPIPQNLRKYAGLTKEVITIGVGTRIEIWANDILSDYRGDEDVIDDKIAMRMADLGI